MYIDEINAGEYKVTGYAKNKDGECIGYGITAAVVLPEDPNDPVYTLYEDCQNEYGIKKD